MYNLIHYRLTKMRIYLETLKLGNTTGRIVACMEMSKWRVKQVLNNGRENNAKA